jgi:putative ABC transport system permease protein
MLRDFSVALRSLLRSPGFTVAAVLCLALAIGANTAIFSVIDAVLLRPLPYAQPDRLVMLWERSRERPEGHNVVSPANFRDWRSEMKAVADAAAIVETRSTMTGLGDPVQLPIEAVTASFFRVLGVAPAIGRAFTDADDVPNAASVVVVSDGFWRQRLGADPDALGRTITLGGSPAEIVGVMPPGFTMPGSSAALWVPLGLDPSRNYRLGSGRFLTVIGRLAPDATVAQADAELRTIAKRLEDTYQDFNAGWTATVVSLQDQVVGGTRRTLLVLAGVVAFVLLIACANVANLALARAAARQREIAVRAALGASRWQVMRAQLAESLLVAGMGGALGMLLALWGTTALVAAAPSSLPRAAEIGVDERTLLFTTLLSLLTGVFFGLAPALQSAREDLQSTLKDGARGASRSRARGALVVVQVALSLVLLVGAGLLIRSFARLSSIDAGFDGDVVFSGKVSLPFQRYAETGPRLALVDALVDRVRALPGVRAAGATWFLPFDGPGSRTSYWVGDRPIPESDRQPGTSVLAVTPGYFETLGIPVLQGTPFTAADGPTSRRVVVINEALAKASFPNENPVGRQIHMPWGDTLKAEIVAVVANVRSAGLDSMPEPTSYWPMTQFRTLSFAILARTDGDPMRLAAPIAAELHALDADLPLADPRSLDSYRSASIAARRFTMLLLGAFATVALVLAAIGIAGVIANSVAQRTREIGVRLALGAQPGDVMRMVLRQGMTLVGAGIGLGVVGAFALTRVLESLLYGTEPTDAPTFIAVAALLGAIALAATWVPARRATLVSPLTALQAE